MSQSLPVSDLEIINRTATFLFRGLGYKILSERVTTDAIITTLEDNKKVVTFAKNIPDVFTVIYINGELCKTIEIEARNLCLDEYRPKTLDDVDELSSQLPSCLSIIGFIWVTLGEAPYDLYEGIPKKGPVKQFLDKKFMPKISHLIPKDETPFLPAAFNFQMSDLFSKDEVDMLLYDIVKPKIVGELLFPRDGNKIFKAEKDKKEAEKKAKADRKVKRAKIRAEKAKRAELKKEKQLKKQAREKTKKESRSQAVDKYPIYNPPPLSGFEPDLTTTE